MPHTVPYRRVVVKHLAGGKTPYVTVDSETRAH